MDELARLRNSITRHASDGLTRTARPGISVVCSTTTSEPLCGIAEPTLAVVAQGVKDTTLNGRTFTYGAGQFLVVSVDLVIACGRGASGNQTPDRALRAPAAARSVCRERFAELTDRELEILRLLTRGFSNAEIAQQLYLSEATVKTHVTRVPAKLGVRDRVQGRGSSIAPRL